MCRREIVDAFVDVHGSDLDQNIWILAANRSNNTTGGGVLLASRAQADVSVIEDFNNSFPVFF